MSGPPVTARKLAFQILRRIDSEGAYANLVLPAELDRSRLPERDRAFVTELVYGTTRMRRGCDALVDRFIAKPPPADLRTALRMGAYQLHYLGVPAHAAVGETVAMLPQSQRPFINAVLRKVATNRIEWPSEALRLSYPDWIVERLTAELGDDDAIDALSAMNVPSIAPTRDDGYQQDLASQWVAAAVEAQPGELVLDMCAAPGGKATALAATGAHVVAADLHLSRASLVAASARRTGHPVSVVCADGGHPPLRPGAFDRVLLDAPCSGLGAMRRRADARWRIKPSDVDALAEVQVALLDAAATLVRPGGTLVYSVCTLTDAESVDHATPAGFDVIDESPGAQWRPHRQGFRILPQDRETDGMTMIRYRRRP